MKMPLAVILVAAAFVPGGCVEREMTITSQPTGALVFVSDKEIGRTPVTQPFLWYGDYDITMRLKGYETLHTHREIDSPWYETIPLDLFSAMAPWTYHDRRYLHFELTRYKPPEKADLLRRARQFGEKAATPIDE